ncbi:helix-turn-helix domain-containing protein [Streptomyces althioticus]|uniref:helix-turn-helix domain-containing protein n=1 Tax=Streptomyces althioticus TaxID=83380 RepID=UPI0033199F46
MVRLLLDEQADQLTGTRWREPAWVPASGRPIGRSTGQPNVSWTGWPQTVPRCRSALGWSTTELARRAKLSEEDVEAIEESSVEPTLELIERLVTALEAGARIDPRSSPEFRFEGYAA